jgi:acyl-CoA synthetase (AMP-forming)/AMP-acid ligase II/flavin-dependent dehydrogenase/acyl carrier protein
LPVAAHKVGEASTEIGSHYLAEILGIKDYLDRVHYRKFGLRFFFQNEGGPFHQRPEIGLTTYIAPYAYNFDRGILESDLRGLVAASGVELLEGCSIRDIGIAEGSNLMHRIAYTTQAVAGRRVIEARWVVDAMGRRRFLQKKLGIAEANCEGFSAAWFRMEGRIDVSDLVPAARTEWHERVSRHPRYDATNHLCGAGYWIWLIRLSSGYTSIGLVADENLHSFREYSTYPKMQRWLQLHEPDLARLLGGRRPVDFRKMPRYSYSAKRIFSSKRWACVGEAATFTDPLYGTGTDMIGLANCLTTRLIKSDLQQGFNEELVEEANLFFLSFNDGLVDNIRTAYNCFGHPLAMAMKTIWDTMAGWAFTAPMLFNSLYIDPRFRQKLWPEAGHFFQLAHRVQTLFQAWAAAPLRGRFEFIDYLALPFVRELRQRNLQSGQADEELLSAHRANMETFEEFAQVIFLLALEDTAPQKLRDLPPGLWFNAWGISLDETRWRRDRLFSPNTEPRDLKPMWDQMRRLIRFPSAPPVFDTKGPPALAAARPFPGTPGIPVTLPDALRRAASGDKGAVFLQEDGREVCQSYEELLQEATRICAGLKAHGKKPGDIVALQLSRNQDLVPAIWGCLMGGFVVAPVAVASVYQKDSPEAGRFWTSWQVLGTPTVVTSGSAVHELNAQLTRVNGRGQASISIEELRSHAPACETRQCSPEALAILLLTSGSTGVPKAVQLRHSSILSRAEGRARHFGFSDQDVSVNWFPLDHVASLVMFHLRDVYLGCRQVHAPTRYALEDPLRWLDWLSRYQASVTWAPNFAYALVNKNRDRVPKGDWDLSCVRCMLNGGEPVDVNTVSSFLDLLSGHGLRADVIYADWGMTEIASGVVCPDPIVPAEIRNNEFCLGIPIPGTAFRVVDEMDRVIPERDLGRVQVTGSTVTEGYYGNPERTRELFTDDGWLDTGDLGYIENGKLTVTGRAKEVVIINGVNFNCGEIEEIVERIDGVLVSYTVACSLRGDDSDTDQLAIFFCSGFRAHDLVAEQVSNIRAIITRTLGISSGPVVPVAPHDVPKSSIGKILRPLLLNRLANGAFDQLLEEYSTSPESTTAPLTEMEEKIMDIWARAFDQPWPGLNDNFFDLGGHSLTAVQIIMNLQESFGTKFSINDLFESPTVKMLADKISSARSQRNAPG